MGVVIRTIAGNGLGGMLVDVECHITNGLPALHIVGSANSVINESRERVRNAILSSDFIFPRRRISLNLAPGEIPKHGTAMDVALAVAILRASEQLPLTDSTMIFLGELSLDGTIRPLRGIIGKLLAIPDIRNYTVFIPLDNIEQAQQITGLQIVGVRNLKDLHRRLLTRDYTNTFTSKGVQTNLQHVEYDNLVEHIVGHSLAKRALAISAAGGHSLLLHGPPGSGKTMLARALNSILPAMNSAEIVSVTHLHSIVSDSFQSVITKRPFRSPHHTISYSAMTGGGTPIKPGEISLAHNGVLFLDELPEFNRQAIEALRQPIEDKHITISRINETVVLPANFTLVATANPCPCGFFGTAKECTCNAHQISQYQHKLSGPLLDRIDLHVSVEEIDYKHLMGKGSSGETSSSLRKLVEVARTKQRKRYGKFETLNSTIPKDLLIKSSNLEREAKIFLNNAAKQLQLSGRSYFATLRVARTIADMDSSDGIAKLHVAEALQYRNRPARS